MNLVSIKRTYALFIHKFKGEWKPWTKGMISDRMHKFGEIIGLPDFHPHCMRKTSINKIYEDTGDLNLASQWANHRSSAVTQQSYIRPVSKSELRNKLKLLKFKNAMVTRILSLSIGTTTLAGPV